MTFNLKKAINEFDNKIRSFKLERTDWVLFYARVSKAKKSIQDIRYGFQEVAEKRRRMLDQGQDVPSNLNKLYNEKRKDYARVELALEAMSEQENKTMKARN